MDRFQAAATTHQDWFDGVWQSLRAKGLQHHLHPNARGITKGDHDRLFRVDEIRKTHCCAALSAAGVVACGGLIQRLIGGP